MVRGKLIYPGSAQAKDRVRKSLYHACSTAWGGDRAIGDALTLCGNEPLDGPEMFALGFPHNACWFVDNRIDSGLAKAKLLWPDVNVLYGEVKSLLQYRKFSLINLDLMDQLSYRTGELIELAGKSLVNRGILVMTFVRARERVGTSARHALNETGAPDLASARIERMREVLRPIGRHKMIFYEQYQAHSIAMSTVAVIKR